VKVTQLFVLLVYFYQVRRSRAPGLVLTIYLLLLHHLLLLPHVSSSTSKFTMFAFFKELLTIFRQLFDIFLTFFWTTF
jgi:hypothetical protein